MKSYIIDVWFYENGAKELKLALRKVSPFNFFFPHPFIFL